MCSITEESKVFSAPTVSSKRFQNWVWESERPALYSPNAGLTLAKRRTRPPRGDSSIPSNKVTMRENLIARKASPVPHLLELPLWLLLLERVCYRGR